MKVKNEKVWNEFKGGQGGRKIRLTNFNQFTAKLLL